MSSMYKERTKRKNAFDVDDDYLAQRKYLESAMASDLEILSIKKESTNSGSKRVKTTWDLEGLEEELNKVSPKTTSRSSRKFKTLPRTFKSSSPMDLRQELENMRREEFGKSERIMELFQPTNSSATSKQIENVLNLSKSFCTVASPFLDLAISSPSNALILYQPPESLLMKSYHPKVLTPFVSSDDANSTEAENQMLMEVSRGIESM